MLFSSRRLLKSPGGSRPERDSGSSAPPRVVPGAPEVKAPCCRTLMSCAHSPVREVTVTESVGREFEPGSISLRLFPPKRDPHKCAFRAAVRWRLRSRNRTGWPEKFKTLYIATASSLPPPAKKHALSWQKPIRHHPLSPLNQPLTTDFNRCSEAPRARSALGASTSHLSAARLQCFAGA